jgi:hypothetical protein
VAAPAFLFLSTLECRAFRQSEEFLRHHGVACSDGLHKLKGRSADPVRRRRARRRSLRSLAGFHGPLRRDECLPTGRDGKLPGPTSRSEPASRSDASAMEVGNRGLARLAVRRPRHAPLCARGHAVHCRTAGKYRPARFASRLLQLARAGGLLDRLGAGREFFRTGLRPHRTQPRVDADDPGLPGGSF